ncbi:hypothetical protein [Symbioplanes lichenis]|uniref:hypothetical protein n=1 Tax=Symbioplanes lichenis TaxID=1629072 RepID=UPI0027397C2B|nr:hypothetical protein [Actinoplanes lichenis]
MFGELLASLTALVTIGAAAPSEALKDPVRGLLDRNGPAPAAYAEVVDAFVVRVTWAQLQPTREAGTNHGGALTTTAIDTALASGRPVRLRVTAGIDAPGWAKTLGGNGAALPWYTEPTGGPVGTIGAFWSPEFGQAYANLQERLAGLYDQNSELLREVVVSRCTTEFAEPYIRQTGQLARNRAALKAAGYTAAADEQCHRDEIAAHAVWTRTRSYLAFNPYQRITEAAGDAPWTASVDPAFTRAMIDHCRTVLGARCVLGNNSLDPDRPADYLSLYAYMAGKGGPIGFQTATAAKICDQMSPCPPQKWNDTLAMALNYGAGSVELPEAATGYTSWPIEEFPPYHGLRYYDTALE